jgi:hypothetical protein
LIGGREKERERERERETTKKKQSLIVFAASFIGFFCFFYHGERRGGKVRFHHAFRAGEREERATALEKESGKERESRTRPYQKQHTNKIWRRFVFLL